METEIPLEHCIRVFPAFTSPNAKGKLPRGQSSEDDEERVRRLERLLRSEIVPRLSELHFQTREREGDASHGAPTPADIETFAALIVAPDADQAAGFLNRMADRGFDFETLVERLIVPTARHLGELWEEDRCDFFDVTVGVGRLQELIDLLAAPVQEREQKALLIATPGDTHFFGLDVVSAFLRAAGWRVTMQPGLDLEDNARTVAQEWISVVGITVGGPQFLDATARTVDTLRRASRNPDIGVMVGGYIFKRRPELIARIGADGTAPDGPTAVVLAKRLLLRQALEVS